MCFSLYNAAPASKVVDIISTWYALAGLALFTYIGWSHEPAQHLRGQCGLCSDQYSWNFQSVHDTVHPTFVCFIIPDLFRGLQSSAATFIATGIATVQLQLSVTDLMLATLAALSEKTVINIALCLRAPTKLLTLLWLRDAGGASLVRQICSFCVGLAAASAPFGWAAGRLVQVIRPA